MLPGVNVAGGRVIDKFALKALWRRCPYPQAVRLPYHVSVDHKTAGRLATRALVNRDSHNIVKVCAWDFHAATGSLRPFWSS